MLKRLKAEDSLKICSQQVIVDLSNCLKELVENSIDAHATQVEVKIHKYGLDGLEVIDNGHGIHPSQFETIAQRHTTSKMREYEDLEDLSTFGFRGEALSSLCAMAKVTVISNCSDEHPHHNTQTTQESTKTGFKVIYDDMGRVREKTQMARQIGTTVIVKDLFHMLPVRFKDFQRNCKREYHRCVQLLQEYALIATGIRISVYHVVNGGRQPVFVTPGGNSELQDNIKAILGNKISQTLVPIDLEFDITYADDDQDAEVENQENLKKFLLKGLISSPQESYGRNSSDKQYIFLQKRPCKLPKISRKLNEVYRRFNVMQFPAFALILKLAPGTYDINVTPDKKTILIHNETDVLKQLETKLEQFFQNLKGAYDLSQTASSQPTSLTPSGTLTQTKLPFSSLQIKHCIENFQKKQQDISKSIDCQHDITIVGENELTRKRISIYSDEEDESHKVKVIRTVEKIEIDETSTTQFCHELHNVETSDVIEISQPEEMQVKQDAIEQEEEEEEKEEPDVQIVQEISAAQASARSSPAKPIKKQYRLSNTNSITIDIIRNKLLKRKESMIPKETDIEASAAPAIDDPEAETKLKRIIKKDDFPRMKIIGQFNLGFILATLPSGIDMQRDLFVIDQHASDEIFLFHKFSDEATIETQRLVIPKIMELPMDQLLLSVENEMFFKKNGFEFDIVSNENGKKVLRLKSLPVLYGKCLSSSDFEELLSKLENDPTKNCRCSKVRAVFASKACRSAYMIGDALEMSQMRKIVDNLALIERPWNCPHGRPTMRWLLRYNNV